MAESSEIEEIDVLIKRGLIDRRKRRLILNSEFIEFEDKNFGSNRATRFEKSSITDYRYGINWISGIEFTIGREYLIFIRNKDNQVIKISFKSFYGIKRKESHQLYIDILYSLFEFFFGDITRDLLERMYNAEEISIGNVRITTEKLIIKVAGILNEETREIAWEKVGVRNYSNYFVIYSVDDPANINHGYSYLDDWNTGVLYSLINAVLKSKNISANDSVKEND